MDEDEVKVFSKNYCRLMYVRIPERGRSIKWSFDQRIDETMRG